MIRSYEETWGTQGSIVEALTAVEERIVSLQSEPNVTIRSIKVEVFMQSYSRNPGSWRVEIAYREVEPDPKPAGAGVGKARA